MGSWLYINNKNHTFLKKYIATAICFFLPVIGIAQYNLVPNSGFDSSYNACPTQPFLVGIKYWYQINGSADVFHYCGPIWLDGIPQNSVAYQYPISDSTYIGMAVFNKFNNTYRENIGVRLISPLVKDKKYCVEFHVNLADSSDYAISTLGMYFSVDSIYTSNNNHLPFIPQIQNDSSIIISDKENWTKISGSFIAKGGEQFIAIGNFKSDIATQPFSSWVSNYNSQNIQPGLSYYFIDNVSVYACDSPAVEEPQDTTFVFIPNVFSPNQDGENDLWQITASKVTSLNIQVFNRWGEQVYIFNSQNLQQDTSTFNLQPSIFNPSWDGYTPTGKPVPEGTYFYIVQYTLPSGETKVEKGNLTLIR